MARIFLRAVIFDLGGTLMYERAGWEAINAHADEALTNYLRSEGLELNLSTFPREFRTRLSKYFKQREKDLLETTYSFVLRGRMSLCCMSRARSCTTRSCLIAFPVAGCSVGLWRAAGAPS